MKQLLCLLTSLSVFFACSTPNSKDSVKTYKATTDITGKPIRRSYFRRTKGYITITM